MILMFPIAIVLMVLLGNELWWRKQHTHGEIHRKFVHITIGTFVAFWPFFLSWQQIRLLSVAFLVVVVLSKYLHLFKAIHSVQRPTWGEIFFAISVGAITFITQDKWIYAAALLQMALADGLAAVIGVQYGKRQRYLVMGQVKSVVGTSTFILVSTYILLGYSFLSGSLLSIGMILGIALVAGFIENVGVYGLDNLLVPLMVAVLLQQVS